MGTPQDAAQQRLNDRLLRYGLRASTFPLHQWRRRFSPGLWGASRKCRK